MGTTTYLRGGLFVSRCVSMGPWVRTWFNDLSISDVDGKSLATLDTASTTILSTIDDVMAAVAGGGRMNYHFVIIAVFIFLLHTYLSWWWVAIPGYPLFWGGSTTDHWAQFLLQIALTVLISDICLTSDYFGQSLPQFYTPVSYSYI